MVGQGRRRWTSRVLRALVLAVLAAPAACVPAAQAAISVADVSVSEASGEASFTVTRTAGLLTGNTTVVFSTADGTARAGTDYTAVSGSLFFGSLPLGGEQTQVVRVAIAPDALHESAETVRMLLSGSPEILDGEGVATISDDDPPPTISVADAATTTEGAAVAFTVSLSAPSGREAAVGFTTADGSAHAGQDYTSREGTVAIPAGATSARIEVPGLDDAVDEPDESFALHIGSPASATLGRAAAAATIVDDDEPPPPSAPTLAGEPAVPGATPPAGAPAGAPAGGDPGSAGASPVPQLGLSSPRLRRPAVVLVTVACPRSTSRCSGRVTIFSRANFRSRIKALRRERRLGQRSFTLLSGRTRTLTITLSRSDRVLLMRTGRMLVRAYAVTRDGAGRSSVRRSSGTLIARTSHS